MKRRQSPLYNERVGNEGAAISSDLLNQANRDARNAGVELVHSESGIMLTDGCMDVIGDFSHLLPRVASSNIARELIVRAARIKGATGPLRAVDATAGLGEDSFLLAAAGFSVTLFEQNPTIAVLLQDAIRRARALPELEETARRMNLVVGDSVSGLRQLGETPDVVLLDPMFPERRKSAAVKKKLQLLQRLEQPCEDEQALLEAAFAARPRKIVVKRPAKGPYLANRKPDYSLSGKAVRFDCYTGR